MGESDRASSVSSGVMGKHIAYTDGGARSNPGPAGIGFVLQRVTDGTHEDILDAGAFIGETTNNVAEYYALIWALENALHLDIDDIEVRSDSLLVVSQVRGEWKIKQEHLRLLCVRATSLGRQFERFTIVHIPREENERADMYANMAMDEGRTVGNYAVEPELDAISLF